MQERHPVDDLFRQGLAFAEVSPPAHVWTGVKEKRKRRFGAWRFWLLGAAALTLGAGVIALTQLRPATADGQMALSQKASANAVPSTTSVAEEHPASAIRTSTSTMAETRPIDPAQSIVASPSPYATTGSSTSSTPVRSSAPASGPVPPLPTQLVNNVDLSPSTDASRTTLSLLPLLSTEPTFAEPGAPRLATSFREERYVLPKGWFWFSLQGGLYREDLDHTGRDQGLAAAWNRSLSSGTDRSIGVLGGRSWRSGFGLSVGAEYHSIDQELSYSDRRDSTLYTTYTEVTVLDMVVLATLVDTVPTVIDQSVSGSGTLRTTAFVLPVEGYWHKPLGRWEAGMRFGLAWEHLRSTGDLLLFRPTREADIALLSGSASGSPYTQDLISTSLALDLGFHLTERWSFWLSPTYQRGLVSLQGNDPYQVLPERLGIRTRITFSLP